MTNMTVNDLQAYQQGLYGPHIQWIQPIWFTEDYWMFPEDCLPEQVLQVINGSLYMG